LRAPGAAPDGRASRPDPPVFPARFGYLWLGRGKWGDKQILPPVYVKAAIAASGHGPDYGYLWWFNALGKNLPDLPTTAYSARRGELTDASVLVQIDADVFFQPPDHFPQERREPLVLLFEVGDARLECRGTFPLLRDLALLIEIPEQTHSHPPLA
jgi:hypothetical protein